MSVQERVLAGAAALDRLSLTDWVDRIDLDTLDVDNVESCVLGQLYGRYWRAVRVLSQADGVASNWSAHTEWARCHGFDVILNGRDHWGDLQQAWYQLIWRRQVRR